jgi:photosystem II stability/assembly factor-like uncharacterized protein
MTHGIKSILRVVLLAAGLLIIPCFHTSAQEETYVETFDTHELPGWEHTQGAVVSGGILRIEPGNFARYDGAFEDFMLTVRTRWSGDGNLAITYRSAGQTSYHLLVAAGALVLQRESGGAVHDVGRADITLTPGEWWEVTIIVAGNEHSLAVDGKPAATIIDDGTALPAGAIDFETLGALTLEIDQMTLTLGAQTSSQAARLPAESGQVNLFPDAAGLSWVYLGGPPGGLGYDIRMDPRNSEVMYVTDAWAGAFKSLDGGQSWFPINEGITARVGPSGDGIPVFSLSIDPNNPDTLWAGTQFNGSVFRSDDGGENWRSMSTGILEKALTIRGITVEPGNSEVVYLGGEVSSWEWNGSPLPGLGLDMTKGVVYKSVNGGQSWTRIWYGDNLTRYIWISPQDHNLVYVSTGIFDREAANSDPAALKPGGVGILRSHDGGASWEELGVANGFAANELYVGSLFMHPQNPEILLAAAGSDTYLWKLGSPLGGIYLTEDGGDTWRRVQGLDDASAVEFCQSDPRVAYAGSLHGLYRSDDGGHTWTKLAGRGWGAPDIVAGFPIDMQCDPHDPQRIFINNYNGGNFLSQDGGQTWIDASRGYTGALMRHIAVAPDNPAHLYATERSGVFRSDDGGRTWQGLAHGPARALEATGLAIDPKDSQHVIAAIGDAGIAPRVTTDGGQTWRETDLSWLGFDRSQGNLDFQVAFSPSDAQRVLVFSGTYNCWWNGSGCESGYGILLSSDGGESWERSSVSKGVAFDVAFSSNGTAYAALYPDALYRSDDGGQNWELVSQSVSAGSRLAGATLTAIAADGQDPERIYAGFYRGGVMVSQDGGETWKTSSAGMSPEATVRDIIVDVTRPGVVYAAAHDSGVLVSHDSGATWKTLNSSLISRAGVDLALSTDGSVLYLAVEGAGVSRLSVYDQSYFDALAPSAASPAPDSTSEAEPMASSDGPVLPTPFAMPAGPSSSEASTPFLPVPILAGVSAVAMLSIAFAVIRKRLR